jgi:hypothetical protein
MFMMSVYHLPTGVSSPGEHLFSSIHDDPRWLPFLESIGKSPAQLVSVTLRWRSG